MTKTTILAIDSATIKAGYALLQFDGNDIRLLDWGCWNLKGELPRRLFALNAKTNEVINTDVDILAVEELRINRGARNLDSMVKVAYAIGAVLSAFGSKDPERIKMLPANVVRRIWDVDQNKASLREAVNKKFLEQIVDNGRPYGFLPKDQDIVDAIGLGVAVWAIKNNPIKSKTKKRPVRKSNRNVK